MPATPSSSAASEPDIEDLIKCEASDATADNVTALSTQHNAERHDFRPQEVLATRMGLLDWYDAHRRKLPWRGDPPPYLTTATHTSQKKKVAAKKTGLETFLKKEMEDVKSDKVEEQVAKESDSAVKPRKVAPYETWVSEIMLQQTRVDTVVDYFLRWIDKFPTVAALGEANEEDVNALWAGLGYYRRARMLHAGAKYVVENYGGELPSTVDQLLTIPGIGPYTAGAIASIAFENREPLVDGNVIRVMARMRAVGADPKNKQLINFSWKAAKELVEECDRPGALNQALMELGATMCTVQNPQCSDCPVKSVCLAYEELNTVKSKRESSSVEPTESSNSCTICDYTRADEWDETHTGVTKYPLKAKKNGSRNEVIAVAVVSAPCTEETAAPKRGKRKASKSVEAEASASDWRFLMSKRPDGGLLAGQWEFLHCKMSDGDKIPPFSKRKTFMDSRLIDTFGKTALTRSVPERRDLDELTHIFSHVKHHMGIEHVHFKSQPELLPGDSDELRWMTVAEMKQRGITTGVKKILQLVLHPNKATGKTKTKAKSTSSATSRVSHVTHGGGKRLKTIASFFKK